MTTSEDAGITVPGEASGPAPGEVTGGRRTHPLGFIVRGLQGVKNAFLPMVALVFANDDLKLGLTAAIGLGLVIVILSMTVGYIAWRRLTYRIGTDDIRVESGILSRAARSVPFERIQDVSLEQGLVPRLLGLVEVRFETGAGGKDELKLSFLTEAEGEALRETVRIRNSGPVGSTEAVSETDEPHATPAAAPPLFAMDGRRLLTFGLFEFSLAVVAVFAGAAQQFDFLLPFDLWDFEQWQDRLAGPGAWLQGLGFAAQAAGAVIAAATLIVVGMATGLIRTFTRDWDFRLEETDRGFRRRRGLFTRTDVVMPTHRVQAVQLTTGMIRRFFGWHGLKFISLAQDAGSASHVVAPFAKRTELNPIAQAACFTLPDAAGSELDWRRTSSRYRIDGALIETGALLLIMGAVAANLLFQEEDEIARWLLLLVLPLGALFLAARQRLLWLHERHAFDAHQIYNRTCLLYTSPSPRDRQKSRMPSSA